MSTATIVVPCYNEEQRLPGARFAAAVRAQPDCRFLFVNDGSTDATSSVLAELCRQAPDRMRAIDMERNQGKAEAVRQGVLEAVADRPAYVGFWDADLSTPLDQIPLFCEILDTETNVQIVTGARVKLLGRTIVRHEWRHYLGRVFATATSLTLRLPVYDTQCGAKIFRVTDENRSLFAEPFLSRWFFDVELLARLTAARHGTDRPQPADIVYELPLMAWRDVGGTKLRLRDFLRAPWDLWRIRRRYLP